MHNCWLRLICRTFTQSAALCRILIFNVLIAVSLWVSCITVRAEVLSDPNSKGVSEQSARGKSTLNAPDNPEVVTKSQRTGTDDERPSRGMGSVHTCLGGN